MKKTLIILTLCFSFYVTNLVVASNREKLSLDKGWRFYLGDIPFPVIKGHGESYNNAKAGKAWGAAAQNYDDSEWRMITLPHDWAVESTYNPEANLSQGYRNRGLGWYRRTFSLSPQDKGKHIELQFDGIATYSTVWINGNILHRNWCGYTSMYIDITPYATYGDKINTISIRVDANAQEGWWYEGAGMYRHTWLVKRSPVHIITDGVFANPIKKENADWEIPVEVTLHNSGKFTANSEVEVSLYDAKGELVVQGNQTASIAILKNAVVILSLAVNSPSLWSVDTPTLYTIKAVATQNGKVIDEVQTKCGFRTIRFDANEGFFLNDKHLKIKGVCNHQDHAGVGVAVPDALWEFRLRKLKEMGVNGYRCAHNPPSTEFLDVCDSLGILVMDENRNFNTSPEYVKQLEWLVRRDRNRPSVILWSVFNEEPMQGTENGYEMVRRMSEVVKQLDITRPVTAAMNGGLFSPLNVSQAVDVVGFNYQVKDYDKFHKANPTMKLTSSEDVSAFQTRGEYKTNKSKNIIEDYDSEAAIWGVTNRAGWKAVAERPYLAGCFVWTGFDYRGEPTPFKWPSASSFFGIMDVCGFPKTAFYLHQAQWVENKPILNLVPHWNWPTDTIGKPIKVMALCNADSVVLKLNGKVISGQKVDKYEMNTWMVPYKPGKLEAVGYKNRKMVSNYKVETTSEAVQLRLTPDRKTLTGNGTDAMPITVEVVDSKGRHVPTANIPVEFNVSGSASIIGLGNGNPNSHEAEKGNKRSLFNGLAQVIIQSSEEVGTVILTATAQGMKPTTINIPVISAQLSPFVPIEYPQMILEKWTMSPLFKNKPDPNQAAVENDMNSWLSVTAGDLQKFDGDSYLILRATFSAYKSHQKDGGTILFKKFSGKAEVWLNKKLVGSKTTAEIADFTVPFHAATEKCEIRILIEGTSGNKVGLGGSVIVQKR